MRLQVRNAIDKKLRRAVIRFGFKRALKVGGRLFCIEGTAPAMTAKLITRTGEQSWEEAGLFETVVPGLINAPQGSQFTF